MIKQGWVYILTNAHHTTLYTGATSHLAKRIEQHRTHFYPSSFTAKYNCTKLVYFCRYADILEAIAVEKKIKAGSRTDKVHLISKWNPEWKDLWNEWNESNQSLSF